MSKIKILVTGGAGYIGSHTIIELIETGKYLPICVDNCSRSTPETLHRIEKITGIKVPFYKIDLCEKDAVTRLFRSEKNIQGVIHFAAYKAVGESNEKPIMYYRNNLASIENILEACVQHHVPHFIFSSSCSIYGEVTHLPVSEETPIGAPFCAYAHTKQVGEEMIQFMIGTAPQLQAVILRYFNPVGAHPTGMNGELSPDKPNNLMPIITQTGIGRMESFTVFGNDYETRDGSCIRDYIHVVDIAQAHIAALELLLEKRNSSQVEVFNLGSGNGITVLEMIENFEKLTQIKLNYSIGERRSGDIPAIYSNSAKAKEELGWEPKITLPEMIASAWKWEQYMKENNIK